MFCKMCKFKKYAVHSVLKMLWGKMKQGSGIEGDMGQGPSP